MTDYTDYEGLNLGCGGDHKRGYWNVDRSLDVGPDQVVDLNEYPWPWEDNSFYTVCAKHILEHLDRPIRALEEVCRVLKPRGEVYVRYPIGHTRFEDPTHRTYWNYNTAAAISGDRKHGHEYVSGLELVQQSVAYNVSSPLWRVYTQTKRRLDGPGAWLSQVPTLYGHVNALYRYEP